MSVDLDEHNQRRDNIIAHEKATHGVAGVEIGRMMRATFELVFWGVAGFAAWLEARLEEKSVECENKTEQIERLEAVVSELRERLEATR